MSSIDWVVLVFTLLFIVLYGIWKSRGQQNLESYLLANRQLPWYQVGLSVMATQASAITFLSAPGQAFGDGLRFIQFYFGLPLAMIVLCITFIPNFQKLNVYTAYEYLEQRFDLKTRTLTAFLFLVQRGLSTGITIYAPSIVLSSILQIDIRITTLLMGGTVVIYTVYGGTKAVSYTQMLQMGIIFSGLFMAGYMVIHLLPGEVGFVDALHIAGKMGRLNAIDTHLDWNNRYNIWSGIVGGFFLQLSYFGTDQSQVGRYLTAKNTTESRLGLIMNGLIKIPMQFLILLLGTLVFSFYQFYQPPVFFNEVEVKKVRESPYKADYEVIESQYARLHTQKKEAAQDLLLILKENNETQLEGITTRLQNLENEAEQLRSKSKQILVKTDPAADTNDTNYVFLYFVLQHLPKGMVGLLIAIIFLASMGSTASGLSSLASTTVVDGYKRLINKKKDSLSDLQTSRWATVAWGLFCIAVALYAGKLGNLIEAVNILGSLFYGTILGIFLTAFYLRSVGGNEVFYAALVAELLIIFAWLADLMAFLWLNVLGAGLVMLLAIAFHKIQKHTRSSQITPRN